MEIKLSISLLASDRRESLERCLDSLKPLLTKVPCELIIVFTGTDEEVKKIAEKYTPQVIPFQWCSDFSAARNAGLEKAQGEWFLYLDDDEWFEDVEEICDFFLSGEYRDYCSAHYIQRNYQDWDGTKYSDFSAFRLVQRFPGTRFQNPIHEELAPRKEPCKFFQTYVHHYGYVKLETKKSSNQKTTRNISLLKQSVREQPAFVKNYLQLTKEYDLEGDWKTAEKYCREGLSICSRSGDSCSKGWLQTYLSHLLCSKPGKQQAITEIEEIIKTEHPSKLTRLILYQQLVHLYKEEKEHEKAVHYGIKFERLLADVERKPELWEKQGYGEFDENYVKNPERLYALRADCTACALELEDLEHAFYFMKLFPWKEENLLCRYYPDFEKWRENFGSGFAAIASRILDFLADHPDSPDFPNHIKRTDSFGKSDPLDISIISDSAIPVYLVFIRALGLLKEGRRTQGERLSIWCMEHSDVSYLQQVMLREALRYCLDISELAARMDLYAWDASMCEVVKSIPYTRLSSILVNMEKLREGYPFHALCLKKYVLKQRLFKGFFMWEELTGTLEDYCRCILKFYKAQYNNEMFEEKSRALLPGECSFALTSLDALGQVEGGQLTEAVHSFRRCIKIFPSMTGVLRELLRQAVRRVNDPGLHMGEEFYVLAGQMKGTLSALLSAGETVQAAGILNQLLPLMPEDVELVRMRQELIRRIKL